MLYYDHETKQSYRSADVLARLAKEKDYPALLTESVTRLEDFPAVAVADVPDISPFSIAQRHVAYSLNQESFKFLLDPMIETGRRKSAPWAMAAPRTP